VFFTLDLVDLAKNRKNYSGALFRDIWVKVEKFKNILNELQEFPTCNFSTFFGRCIYHCAKIHSLSSRNKLSKEMRVFGLRRFLAYFSFF